MPFVGKTNVVTKFIATVVIAASVGAGAATSCSSSYKTGSDCGDGRGTWLEDESSTLRGGYTVIVRICVDEAGKVLELEVE